MTSIIVLFIFNFTLNTKAWNKKQQSSAFFLSSSSLSDISLIAEISQHNIIHQSSDMTSCQAQKHVISASNRRWYHTNDALQRTLAVEMSRRALKMTTWLPTSINAHVCSILIHNPAALVSLSPPSVERERAREKKEKERRKGGGKQSKSKSFPTFAVYPRCEHRVEPQQHRVSLTPRQLLTF